jgi:hypothetical protein
VNVGGQRFGRERCQSLVCLPAIGVRRAPSEVDGEPPVRWAGRRRRIDHVPQLRRRPGLGYESVWGSEIPGLRAGPLRWPRADDVPFIGAEDRERQAVPGVGRFGALDEGVSSPGAE